MIKLQRLNLDSSWMITLDKISVLVDPWLVGDEVDGFRWLNQAWHVKEPVPVDQLPPYQYILITQSYEDHCHLNTLAILNPNTPIVATQKACDRLRKHFPDRKIIMIPEDGAPLPLATITLKAFRPTKRLDPVYFAVLIKQGDDAIFYSPHGFALQTEQLKSLEQQPISLLMTTFTSFRLPGIMGGLVNPGIDNVKKLVEQLKPKRVVNTHDEEKKASGLVSLLARIKYPNYHEAETLFPFVHIKDYTLQEIKT